MITGIHFFIMSMKHIEIVGITVDTSTSVCVFVYCTVMGSSFEHLCMTLPLMGKERDVQCGDC